MIRYKTIWKDSPGWTGRLSVALDTEENIPLLSINHLYLCPNTLEARTESIKFLGRAEIRALYKYLKRVCEGLEEA